MVKPRAVINQVFQWGAKNGPGDGGAAVNRASTLASQIGPVASGAFGMFRPSGGKYVGQVVPTDIYGEGPFNDAVDFNTEAALFAGNVGFADGGGGTPDGGGAFDYEFAPVPFGELNTLLYIVQEGQAGAVYNYDDVQLPDLSLRFMRTGASTTTGRFLGRKLPPGTALTDATQLQGRALNGIKTGVWQAASWEELVGGGSSRLSPRALDISWRHNGIFAPFFSLDDSVESYDALLEGAADAGFQITVIADVDESASDIAGLFNYSSMEEGDKLFTKVLNIGPLIHDDVPYSLEMNMAGEISGPPRRTNVGNLRAWQWDVVFVPEWQTPNPVFNALLKCSLDPSAFAVA